MKELMQTALGHKEAQIDELLAKITKEGYADNLSMDDIRRVQDGLEGQRAFRNARLSKFRGRVPKMGFGEIKTVIDRYEQTLPAWRLGRCYQLTGKFLHDSYIILADEDFRIVHGYVSENGVVFDHSWIEINGFLYDPVFRDFEVVNAVKKARRRKAAYKYTPRQANKFMISCGHWGPWEDLPERTTVRYDNEVFNCQTGELLVNL